MTVLSHLRLNGRPWTINAGAAIGTGGGTGGTGSTSGTGSTGGGSSTTNPGGNITPGTYVPLTDIAYSQVEPWGIPVANNGDNYKSVDALFGAIGGTGPFVYSIDNPTFVSWNVTQDPGGSRSTGTVKHGWISGPGGYPDSITSVVLRITDALGATVTKTISSFDKTLTGPCISVSAIRSWPNNVTPDIRYCVADAQGNLLTNSTAITLTDPSGLWQIGYGSISPRSGVPPVGDYPLTLSASGFPSKTITVSITLGQMGGIVVTNRASVVSTASPVGWPVFTAIGSTPYNTPVYSLDDTGGAYQIDPATGLVTVANPTKLTIGTNYLVVHQSEGSLTTSLTVSVPVVQGTNFSASAISYANVRQTMTNDEHNVTLGAPTVTGINNPKWFIAGYSRYNPYAAQQQAAFLAGTTGDNGTTAQFVIDQNTGQITAPFWVDAGLDGTSTFTYYINLYCTDGTTSCGGVLPIIVSWAPVSRTVYIGRGMSSAHGADGFEHIADFRSGFVGSDINPHTGTVRVLISADADPDYYADDTGTKTGDYACRFPWPGPIVIEGVAANGVAQPRTGGRISNNSQSGRDMRGKGFWTFGNGQGVLKNIEVSCVHGADATHGIEATRKDGATYGSLSVLNCNIHDCDQGVETGNWIQGGVLIDGTELAACGTAHVSAGACHGAYIGQCSYAEVKNSVSRHATVGHALKCRAMVSSIHGNRLYDGLAGNGSSLINLPDGGQSEVYNNVLVKGTMGQVNDALRYGEDLPNHVWLTNTLNFHDNICDVYQLTGAHFGIPTVVGHLAGTNKLGTKSQVTMTSNSVWLAPGALVWSDYGSNGNQIASTGQTTETGTTLRTVPTALDTSTRPYLSGSIPALGPMYRVSQWGGDSYPNFDDAGQYADRDAIVVSASAPVGTVLANIGASNDLANQGTGTPNPWGAGTTAGTDEANLYYGFNNPVPWTNNLVNIVANSNGTAVIKTAKTLTAGVYWVQSRLVAPSGRVSNWRYPIVVTA